MVWGLAEFLNRDPERLKEHFNTHSRTATASENEAVWDLILDDPGWITVISFRHPIESMLSWVHYCAREKPPEHCVVKLTTKPLVNVTAQELVQCIPQIISDNRWARVLSGKMTFISNPCHNDRNVTQPEYVESDFDKSIENLKKIDLLMVLEKVDISLKRGAELGVIGDDSQFPIIDDGTQIKGQEESHCSKVNGVMLGKYCVSKTLRDDLLQRNKWDMKIYRYALRALDD